MYQFKKINKTKLYQLVKEFAGIRNLPPMRQCQFGYYSRTNTCYLAYKECPESFVVTYDHWKDDVYLLVSQKPDLELTYPERKNEVVHLNLYWLHRHGFIDEVSETLLEITDSTPDTPSQSTDSTAGSPSEITDSAAGSPSGTVQPADLWHDIRDLPAKTGDYLVLCSNGAFGIRRFILDDFRFWSSKAVVAWTDQDGCVSCTRGTPTHAEPPEGRRSNGVA